MSKINELIKELCPNGVEYKAVGEICETITDYVAAGSFKDLANNVKYLQEPDYAMLIRTTDIKSKFKGDKFIYIDESAFKYLWRVNLNKESLILPNIGNCGEVYYLTPEDLPYKRCSLATNAILVRSEKVNMKYLKHVFLANDFQLQLKKITSPAGQTKFNKTDLKKLRVPIPPLEIQEEIVRILDKFGKLEAELEAELEARQSQYEFWRGKLLDNVPNKTNQIKKCKLEDIAKFTYGFTDTALDNGDARYIRITDISETGYLLNNDIKYLNISSENEKYLLKKGDLVVARTGASYGKTLYFDDDNPSIYASYLIKIDLDNSVILNRYYWHFSKSYLYWNQANNLVSKAGQPQFNSNAIKKIEISVPPL